MTFVAEIYPPYWRAMRRVKLEQARYRCQECGVEHLSVRQNLKSGEDYLVYLSVAHKKQYQTWLKDAETMVLCQRCHRRYDRQFRRKGKARTFTPIGYARLYIEQDGRPTLVEMPSTYAQLRDVVDSLPMARHLKSTWRSIRPLSATARICAVATRWKCYESTGPALASRSNPHN